MQKWEYKIINPKVMRKEADELRSFSSRNDESSYFWMTEVLNGYGLDGWELVAVTPDPSFAKLSHFLLKRPKAEDEGAE